MPFSLKSEKIKSLHFIIFATQPIMVPLFRYASSISLVSFEDYYFLEYKRVIEVLDSIAKKYASMIAPHLPYLHALILTRPSESVYEAILTIQKNCKYYNYDIHQQFYHFLFHNDKTETFNDCDRSNITIQIDKLGNLNTGNITIHGNQVGEQNNYSESTKDRSP